MSESHPDSQSEQHNPPQGPAKDEKGKKDSPFSLLNKDLQKALNNWDVLSEEMNQKLSPEEEQLKDVKRLLGELKAKLQEFGD